MMSGVKDADWKALQEKRKNDLRDRVREYRIFWASSAGKELRGRGWKAQGCLGAWDRVLCKRTDLRACVNDFRDNGAGFGVSIWHGTWQVFLPLKVSYPSIEEACVAAESVLHEWLRRTVERDREGGAP